MLQLSLVTSLTSAGTKSIKEIGGIVFKGIEFSDFSIFLAFSERLKKKLGSILTLEKIFLCKNPVNIGVLSCLVAGTGLEPASFGV